MKLPEEAVMLRIYIGESDHYNGRPLYEEIVLRARSLNLAGATALRGLLGFGANSRIHAAKLMTLSGDLPIVIEIVDTEEKISLIMPFIDDVVKEGLVTMERMRVIKYRHGKGKNPSTPD
jgi:PII-like signaling protein